ncbi:MAG: Gfo/Idh/MocA family oxidoreductase [Ferruginibacter sp.]|nr:Gfo/Idh/MocA family oxidoreductase [Cytophagales bacterium]
MERRKFIQSATAAGIGLGIAGRHWSAFGKNSPAEKVIVGVMGTNGRGAALAGNLARQAGAEVAYICDVDDKAMAKGMKAVTDAQKRTPKGVKDFRKALEDKSLDALVIAAPDHWHAPAAMLACAAGKHVYVEKPCGHNPREGELLVEAARTHQRVVQMGSQRRSWPYIIEAMGELKNGIIGRVYFAKGWYTNNRAPIGVGKPAAVPSGLDYELWQGPAPRKPYRDNLIHYNWHWFWNWGTGEACNNGTHEIDVMRWGLGVDYPIRVTSSGGRYAHRDDWETPDTQVISFEFADQKAMTWEGRSCNSYPVEGAGRGVIFYGEKGSMVTTGDNAYAIYDPKNKLVKEVKEDQKTNKIDPTGPGDRLDAYHLVNFMDCIRNGGKPNADIETGHRSVLLCHLGNIAQRTARTLRCDPAAGGKILDDREAMALWHRDYEPGWEPKV